MSSSKKKRGDKVLSVQNTAGQNNPRETGSAHVANNVAKRALILTPTTKFEPNYNSSTQSTQEGH
jgi:hypothetical protein